MKLLASAASHRSGSLNQILLNAACAWISQNHPKIELNNAPYSQWDTPLFNDETRADADIPPEAATIHALCAEADALMLAVPEYNWSCPGSLKTTLDWLSVCSPIPLKGKAAFLLCATPSERGGIVGLSHLKTILEGLGMYVYPAMFPLGRAHQAFTESGLLADASKAERLQAQLTGFLQFAASLHTQHSV